MPTDRWLALTIHLPPTEVPPGGSSDDGAPPAGSDQGALWAGAAEATPESAGPLSPSPVREMIPELLLELGGRGVEEKRDSFTTYLLPPQDLDVFLQEARGRIREVAGPEGELSWAWQPQEDWDAFWRRGLGPRRITGRLTVAPTWDIPEVGEGEVLIVLDPGMAFGTAEHATTRGCLRLLDTRVREGDRVADIGSGSGILSIAAAMLGARHVLAVESDPMSCEAAEENVLANGVGDRVSIQVAEVQGTGPLPDGPYDGVVANIQRFILLPLLAAFRNSLTEGGWLILSGLLTEEREEILAATAGIGLRLDEEDQEGEWWSGAFTRSGPSH